MTSWGARVGALAVLTIGCLLAHANTLDGPFVYDDAWVIEGNASIRSLPTATSPPSNTAVAGRPGVNLSFALNHAIGGLEPSGYRAANVALHLLCTWLLFAILCHHLAWAPAFAAALLWCVHPLQTETVHYVTQRTEGLMAAFYLLTLLASLRAREAPRAGVWSIVAVLASAAGMTCKEVMVSAPIMVLLQDRALGAASLGAALRRRPLFFTALASTWLVLAALQLDGPRGQSAGLGHETGPLGYALNQGPVLLEYLRLCFWPAPLALAWGTPGPTGPLHVAASGIVVAGLLAALAAFRSRPKLGFWALWFFVILAPSSSVVPIISEVGAERRMYLPLAGVCVLVVTAVGFGLERALRGRAELVQRGVAAAATAFAASLLTLVSVARNAEYGDAIRLWQSAVAARPENPEAHVNLGRLLALANRNVEAEAQYRRALEIDRNDPLAHQNLGLLLLDRREYEASIVHFQAAIDEYPALPTAHQSLARAYAHTGRYELALRNAENALLVARALNDGPSTESAQRLIDSLRPLVGAR